MQITQRIGYKQLQQPPFKGLFKYANAVPGKNFTLEAYPNPTTGRVKIRIPDEGTFEYRIFNHLGQPVQKGTAENGSEIDLGGQTDGMYFIRVKNGREFTATNRILLFTQ